MNASYDPRYVDFLRYFNIEHDFFECHEVMEELWLEEGRKPLYQGLIQAAVGLYHFSYGNVTGAIKLFRGAIEKLERYKELEIGIDLPELIGNCQTYLKRLEDISSNPFEFAPFAITITDPQLEAYVHSEHQP